MHKTATFITVQLRQIVPLVVLFFAILAVNHIYAAWTAPTANPPNGTTDVPVNIGDSLQTKTGALVAAELGALTVTSDEYCIDTDCIEAWSEVSGSGGGGEFGGMFVRARNDNGTYKMYNPETGSDSCPPGFTEKQMGDDGQKGRLDHEHSADFWSEWYYCIK